jgi:hypothetical protein
MKKQKQQLAWRFKARLSCNILVDSKVLTLDQASRSGDAYRVSEARMHAAVRTIQGTHYRVNNNGNAKVIGDSTRLCQRGIDNPQSIQFQCKWSSTAWGRSGFSRLELELVAAFPSKEWWWRWCWSYRVVCGRQQLRHKCQRIWLGIFQDSMGHTYVLLRNMVSKPVLGHKSLLPTNRGQENISK